MNFQSLDCANCGQCLSSFIERVCGAGNCLECGKYRYQSHQPAYLYLISHTEKKLHKIGFGRMGKEKNRLRTYVDEGWSVQGMWHAADEKKVLGWERQIFASLREKFRELESTEVDPMGKWVEGWADSVSAHAISVKEIEVMIESIATK